MQHHHLAVIAGYCTVFSLSADPVSSFQIKTSENDEQTKNIILKRFPQFSLLLFSKINQTLFSYKRAVNKTPEEKSTDLVKKEKLDKTFC